jgi:hypothetical protein
MCKRYEEEQWRIEHADNATITFTIALHGPHAWEMRMEDSRRYRGISHGWATENPHAWENTIAPVLRKFFDKTRPAFRYKQYQFDDGRHHCDIESTFGVTD